jgi:hypothetical protein
MTAHQHGSGVRAGGDALANLFDALFVFMGLYYPGELPEELIIPVAGRKKPLRFNAPRLRVATPPADPGGREGDPPPAGEEPSSDLTELQLKILAALEGKALRTDALAHRCGCDSGRLFRKKGALPDLRRLGMVDHSHHLGGFFRPDAPPEVADN